MNDHIHIEAVTPIVDGGRYPTKAVVGGTCPVEADIFRDGHEVLRAVVRWRRLGERRFHEAPLEHIDNDRWRGEFPLDHNVRYEFTVEAWTDVYASWLADLRKRVQVGEPIASEVTEGVGLLRSFIEPATGAEGKALRDAVARLERWLARGATSATAGQTALAVAERPALLEAVAAVQPRFGATAYEPYLELWVDRPRALFGAWYELFPRSQGRQPGIHGTFDDAALRLPDICDLGFDVIYLPPIHPVGRSHRKGRNNALTPQPGDPGSPWAIGNEHGGHDAIEPALGTLEDFDRFVATAQALGQEIALDFAIQASPDHPWVAEHPEWFYHRPDGTIKYAENPPKKYQDVYPLNFDTEAREELWQEMLRILQFWIGHGVRIFRVDNPHTKPLVFWRWLIDEVQREHPDVLFLAEAFTRPKVMKSLAKVGFSQSYSYFTWRNDPREMAEYLTELTTSEMAEYLRPNFFTNTPDILPEVLQTGGRPAFKMRLVLAATLSPSYGIYSGYELCENVAVPGTEEYLNSEKYELRVRDWEAPGNIRELIARVNTIRRQNGALQELRNVRFLPVDNPHLLCYVKSDPARENVLLIVVNMDPHGVQQGTVTVPLDAIGEGPLSSYEVRDLLTDAHYTWGTHNFVRLDPQAEPAHILRVERRFP